MNDKSLEYDSADKNNHVVHEKAIHADDGQEIVQSLELTITLIEMALKEADHSVGELITTMTSMACCVENIDGKLEKLHQHEDIATVVDDIELNCKQAGAGMQQAVKSLQFYDQLSQRLIHIYENLQAVNVVIKAPDQQHSALWQNLHKKVRSIYSLEQEQALLNQSADPNIPNKVDMETERNCGDIELF